MAACAPAPGLFATAETESQAAIVAGVAYTRNISAWVPRWCRVIASPRRTKKTACRTDVYGAKTHSSPLVSPPLNPRDPVHRAAPASRRRLDVPQPPV